MRRLFKKRSRSTLLPLYLLLGLCALVLATMEPTVGGSLAVFLGITGLLLVGFLLRWGPVTAFALMGLVMAIMLPVFHRSPYGQIFVVLIGGAFGFLSGLVLDLLSKEKTLAPIEEMPPGESPFAPLPEVPPKTPEKVYSVPRRYDLSMIFTAFVGFALLFGTMQFWELPPVVFIAVALFFTSIGAGQAMLYGGENPRRASKIVGAGFCFLSSLVMAVLSREFGLFIPGAFLWALGGILLGYMGGVLVGGVFLLADAVRKLAAMLRPGHTPGDTPGDTPGENEE